MNRILENMSLAVKAFLKQHTCSLY